MKYLPSIIIAIILTSCVPITNTNSYFPEKKLLHEDYDYESSIGMVQLFPKGDALENTLQYPVLSIDNTSGLRLEFDMLQENAEYLHVTLIHCNYDWTKSNLMDMQILNEYNEFNITQYEFSQNTHIPYIQYGVDIPTPTKSGNYLLVAYRDGNKSNILFSRRFLVFDNQTVIDPTFSPSSLIVRRNTHQQIDLNITFKSLEQVNPSRDIKIAILQNHNWHTLLEGLQPTNIRLDQGLLQYDFFSGENEFPGWNEFRFFDLQSTTYRGMNVAHVEFLPKNVAARISLDKSRNGLAYTHYNNDLNGSYYLQNTDPGDGQYESEYVQVFFELNSDSIAGNVYIVGSYNNWKLNEKNLMQYDTSRNRYLGTILLKQGYYNYSYWVEGKLPTTSLEGSHYQTTNNYEILVYYRNPLNNYDELVGYQLASSNDQF